MRNHLWYRAGWQMRKWSKEDQCVDCGLSFYNFYSELTSCDPLKQLNLHNKAYFRWPGKGSKWFYSKHLPACLGKTNWEGEQDL